jgi:hypothetical protein
MKKILFTVLTITILAVGGFLLFDIGNYLKVNSIQSSGKLIDKNTVCDIYVYENTIYYLWKNESHMLESVMFFLHIYPTTATSLTIDRQPFGFDNLDFHSSPKSMLSIPSFSEYKAVVYVKLPTYKMLKLQTGNYNEKERLWETPIVNM